ncbi:Sulfate starvation-induced protein 2 [Oligella ureolytica]|uniref:Sulfate-binding protein n=3 Tax=Oligella ureolytica TaxID=90244 RepID=A0A378XHD9_9BURK|nr:Sulfate starvation-induced protein 2 [Oligella ureolytica]SUA55802.1 Sulfate starvation-induced protein 2 [Oligella ureolytica]
MMYSTHPLFSKVFIATVLSLVAAPALAATINLLNVSYDPTREFYREYNKSFAKHWKEKTGDDVVIRQSHGGSGAQARSVAFGLDADIVTLALAYDIDVLRLRDELIPEDWQSRLDKNSSPYTSTIVLLVRKGNHKNIQDWNDLARDDVEVITPNPKTSSGARWNYLAAWAYALRQYDNDETKAYDFVRKIFANVSVLDSGARGSTNTFAQRGQGDVLIAWENEAYLSIQQLGNNELEMIVPSLSILAEPPVTLIDKNVDRKGTREVAQSYLENLYSDDAQRLAAKHFYRPSNPDIAAEFSDQFPQIELVTIDEVFGGWTKAQDTHFNDGGVFDRIQADLYRK